MRTTLLIAVLILCLAGSAAAQKDSIWKKKLYKAWLKLNKEPSRQKGVLYEIQDSLVVLSNAINIPDYIDGNFNVSQFKVSSIEKIKIRRKRMPTALQEKLFIWVMPTGVSCIPIPINDQGCR